MARKVSLDRVEMIWNEVQEIKQDIKEIRSRIENLQAFKYKVMGGAAVIATLTSLVIKMLINII